MKLKKIASLMLAGVMAVSMLAGCNTAAMIPNSRTSLKILLLLRHFCGCRKLHCQET